MPSSRGSSQPRDQSHISYVSCIGRGVPYHYATWEALDQRQNSSVWPPGCVLWPLPLWLHFVPHTHTHTHTLSLFLSLLPSLSLLHLHAPSSICTGFFQPCLCHPILFCPRTFAHAALSAWNTTEHPEYASTRTLQ